MHGCQKVEAVEQMAGGNRCQRLDGFWKIGGEGAGGLRYDTLSELWLSDLVRRVTVEQLQRLKICRWIVHVHAGHLCQLLLGPHVELVT